MRYLFSAIAALAALSAASPVRAEPGSGMGIAAVVGEDAISSYDVENRIRFIIGTARLSGTPEEIERIRPQVLRSLIDEKLELQEAAANGVTVSEQEVEQAVTSLEQQRNMTPGTIAYILDQNHVSRETFTQQIRAQLAWNKLLMKKIRPQVRVSDEEIKLAGQRAAEVPVEQPGVPQELKIAVITLPVDKPARETEVKRLGENLVKEVRGGASFEEISRQFSSVAASAGGKVEAFWIRPEQLDPNVAKALVSAKAGTITDAVRTVEGYTIIKIYETRPIGGQPAPEPTPAPKDIEVSIKQILLKLKPTSTNKEADVMLAIGEDVAKHPGSCEEKGVAGITDMNDVDIEVNFIKTPQSELPPAIKIIAGNLKTGDISPPFASYEGIVLYMLCDRKETDARPIDRDRVYGMLMQHKMELEAQKYLRNLQRDTFIEVR